MDQESKKKFTDPVLEELTSEKIDDLYAYSLAAKEIAAEGGGY